MQKQERKREVPREERKSWVDLTLVNFTKVTSKQPCLFKLITAWEAVWFHDVNVSSKSWSIYEGFGNSSDCYIVKGLLYGLGPTWNSSLLLKLNLTQESLWNLYLSQNMNKFVLIYRLLFFVWLSWVIWIINY